ncbi:Crp/Fnr family transcriptional regulator [Pacificimonas sp. ICDLI1SI03]
MLPDGGRQILAYLLPGDMSERDTDVFGGFDHEMEAIGHATVCQISKQTLLETERDHPRIAIALAWAACVERATLQEWIANLGRRSPERRVAHLLCELWKRMAIIGNADGDVMSFPVSQVQLADTVGLTPVTVNRIIQRLRQQNIIILQNGKLQVVQAEQLCTMAGFDAAYLYADNYQAKSHDS